LLVLRRSLLIRLFKFDVTTPHLAYAVLGGFVVMFGMFSLLIREKASWFLRYVCWLAHFILSPV
jgi:hypothetical protein